MAKKFNLMDYMRNEGEKKEETKVLEERVVNLIPSKENFYSMDGIEELKQSIELVGLLQPLLVSEPDEKGKRTVIAGHRRLMALQQLNREGKRQYERVQVVEKKKQDEIVDKLSLIMANRYRDKTEWEKMKETVETDRLLRELKKKVNLKGNIRELLAEIANTNTAKIGMYKLIDEKLVPELMEEFKNGKIGLTVAYKATQIPPERHTELIKRLEETGNLSIKDIEELKPEEQLKGQMEIAELEEGAEEEPEREAEEGAEEEPEEGAEREAEEGAEEEPEKESEREAEEGAEKEPEREEKPVCRRLIDVDELVRDLKRTLNDENAQETLEFLGVYRIIGMQRIFGLEEK